MAETYVSGAASNYDEFSSAVVASTVFHAHEQSMFLGGELIPIINAPQGVVNVPELAAATAYSIGGGDLTADVTASAPTAADNNFTVDLIAARSVVRDLGNVDPNEIGRLLGVAVSKKFDQTIYTALDSATASTADSVPLSVADMYDAVKQIRSNGEMGELYAVLTPAEATNLMKEIAADGFQGEYQVEALRNGYVGSLAGCRMFMSSYITTANTAGYIFGKDALRIGMQQNVNVEIGRRPEAVGNDVVASLHAKGALIDANRAVKLINV